MTPEIMGWLESVLKGTPAPSHLVEFGARYVNGGIHDLLSTLWPGQPVHYEGIDLQADFPKDTQRVTIVADMTKPRDWPKGDLVVCTETLEHVEDWYAATLAIRAASLPGGTIIVTVPAPGFERHDHPTDYWRYTIPDMIRIFGDLQVESAWSWGRGICLKFTRPVITLEVPPP